MAPFGLPGNQATGNTRYYDNGTLRNSCDNVSLYANDERKIVAPFFPLCENSLPAGQAFREHFRLAQGTALPFPSERYRLESVNSNPQLAGIIRGSRQPLLTRNHGSSI